MALRSSFRPSRYVQRDRATPSRAEGPASRRRRRCGLLLQTRSSGVVGPTVHPRGLLLRHLALMWLSYLFHSIVKLCFQFSYNVTPDTTRQDRPVVSDVGCELGSSLCSWHAGEWGSTSAYRVPTTEEQLISSLRSLCERRGTAALHSAAASITLRVTTPSLARKWTTNERSRVETRRRFYRAMLR